MSTRVIGPQSTAIIVRPLGKCSSRLRHAARFTINRSEVISSSAGFCVSANRMKGKERPTSTNSTSTKERDTKYCRACGRLISANHRNFAERRFCSKACSTRRPGIEDFEIQRLIVDLALGTNFRKEGVSIDYVQQLIEENPSENIRTLETRTRPQRRAGVGAGASPSHERDVIAKPAHISMAGTTTPAMNVARSATNTNEHSSQQEGMIKAEFRERVRRAARRLVAFGLVNETGSPTSTASTFECIQHGKPVEASFAKGDWHIRAADSS